MEQTAHTRSFLYRYTEQKDLGTCLMYYNI